MPDGHDADAVRARILERFDMSLGAGLGRLKGRVFRIGHLGDFNDLMLAGTLCGVEMGLALCGVPVARDGVAAALACLEAAARSAGSGSRPGLNRARVATRGVCPNRRLAHASKADLTARLDSGYGSHMVFRRKRTSHLLT